MNISVYDQKDRVKLAILAVAVVLGILSLYYVDALLHELRQRETRQIKMYGAAQATLSKVKGNDELTSFLFDHVLTTNYSIPSIAITVIDGQVDTASVTQRNVHIPKRLQEDQVAYTQYLLQKAREWAKDYDPIEVPLDAQKTEFQFIYYTDSYLLTQLAFYPYVQLGGVLIFAFLLYMIFSAARRSEQNRVWAGLAKETAHQLGTPISSLMAWTEILKTGSEEQVGYAIEIEKDVLRLKMITDRFSHIGSKPALKRANLDATLKQTLQYMVKRVPSKIRLNFENKAPDNTCVMVNIPLFGWVIENLIKNAVDAMNGTGRISVQVGPSQGNMLAIDITDTGKGIPKKMLRKVFRPGYTTKKRGWGLGLTLTKRIVEQYHGGKIYVKRSEKNLGTTFRILIPSADQPSVQSTTIVTEYED